MLNMTGIKILLILSFTSIPTPANESTVRHTDLPAKRHGTTEAIIHPWKNVTATVYNPTIGQCDASPWKTADGSVITNRVHPEQHRWISVSRDLRRFLKWGDSVEIRGISARADGIYTVHDTMAKRFRLRVDILTCPKCLHGKWSAVSIRRVGKLNRRF